jgi:aerobic-type carbon monoxide dehydrogenase small subunit (CoxS/CutS family)
VESILALKVNGKEHEVRAEPDTSLLEVLRNDLGLTGTKYGCGEAQCGACTVLLDGYAIRSCITPVSSVEGKPIRTIEGMAKSETELHPLQQAFLDEGAMQCGYCVPGMIMNAAGLLERDPNATDTEILEHMQGNVCRCCGYPRMLAAVKRAARAMKEKR